jgi:hypothetical protein
MLTGTPFTQNALINISTKFGIFFQKSLHIWDRNKRMPSYRIRLQRLNPYDLILASGRPHLHGGL